MRHTRLLALVAIAAAITLSATAQARVLTQAPPRSIACGSPLVLGVRAEGPGPRTATLTVTRRGHRIAHRHVTAARLWQRFTTFPPRCGATYTMSYRLPDRRLSYHVHVRR